MNLSYLLFPALLQGAQAAVASQASSDFAVKCSNFASTLKLPNTTVWFTEHVTAGTNITLPDNDPTCGRPGQVVEAELCRVAMFVTTSPTSNLSFEAWLPSNWTGRFLSTGNGGVSGCIQYEDMAYGVGLGFSTVSANNGHNGTSALPMFHNPGVVEDFAYRSIHTGVVLGKQTTKQFYGKNHTKSYYLGCSTGGRQGFKEAQDFPDDFDGIVAGAPAIAFEGLQSRSGSFWGITGAPGAPTYLDSDEWAMVQKDILTQCDHLDGVEDGIIEDPNLCQYRPEALICSGKQTENCLTGQQAETVRQVYSPLYGSNGTFIYPRIQPGGSVGFSFVISDTPFPYSTEWFRYVIYEDATWDPSTIGPKDYDAALKKNSYNIQTWKGDLSGIRDRGSKILHYHGLQDGLISSEISQVYYDHVSRTMSLNSTELDDFYRLFRISGCGHCSGGDGASHIGNQLENLGGMEPENNVLLAIVQWVEKGIAPETITGYRYVNGSQENAVEYKRRHCRYPYRNVWDRVGDSKDPDSWSCQL
ncbi:feruloyl esterase [Fusarium albosuccineum]|uniref:Carboxylic ester hydrolase n=1 Tax=Fusarium albosuccineum TaxID=1237068 RepID=A0A8H4KGX5_9HYPO|nr:feruloyl esterase [Fusarium albosuccineum]KAF5013380.1 hypothetical protein FDECE_627 [Fusarium decemcellulare]